MKALSKRKSKSDGCLIADLNVIRVVTLKYHLNKIVYCKLYHYNEEVKAATHTSQFGTIQIEIDLKKN